MCCNYSVGGFQRKNPHLPFSFWLALYIFLTCLLVSIPEHAIFDSFSASCDNVMQTLTRVMCLYMYTSHKVAYLSINVLTNFSATQRKVLRLSYGNGYLRVPKVCQTSELFPLIVNLRPPPPPSPPPLARAHASAIEAQKVFLL